MSTADIIILGVSRTSKTPTSIYLAQRGYKTANLPLVPDIELPPALTAPHTAFVVGLIASPERIAEIGATACIFLPTAISTTTWIARRLRMRSLTPNGFALATAGP